LLTVLFTEYWEVGRPTEALEALELLLPKVPKETEASWRAYLLRQHARLVAAAKSEIAVPSIAESYLLDRREDLARQTVQLVSGKVKQADVEAALARAQLTAPDLASLRAIFDSAKSLDRSLESFAGHMRQAVELARGHGATVLFVGYPFRSPLVEPVQKAAACDNGCEFLEVWPRFEAELEQRDRGELFVADGHCTGAGYRITAELVAARLLALSAGHK